MSQALPEEAVSSTVWSLSPSQIVLDWLAAFIPLPNLSLPPQLQKILAQMQGTLVNSQRQLSLVKAQVQAKDKEATMLGLTSKELDDQSKDGDISFYKGVGKM